MINRTPGLLSNFPKYLAQICACCVSVGYLTLITYICTLNGSVYNMELRKQVVMRMFNFNDVRFPLLLIICVLDWGDTYLLQIFVIIYIHGKSRMNSKLCYLKLTSSSR